ncbi:MAG: hypothetical protein AB7O62_09910 [Pirellulales bacterium]
MAWRLNEQVVRGELYNNRNYCTHGWVQLRGQESPLHLSLTGNPGPDLAGKQLRFEVRDADRKENEEADDFPVRVAWHQVGPTGDMTADRLVKVSDCPVEEMYARTKLGEPPPFEWKRCLYLEWFSQNGRVVIELVDPLIEFFEGTPDDDSDSDVIPQAAASPDADLEPDGDDAVAGLGITSIEIGDDGEPRIDEQILFDEPPGGLEADSDDDELEDPYGLFPDDLEQQFEEQARQTDRSLDPDSHDGGSDAIQEMELMDRLIEQGEGELIGSLFESPVKLPREEALGDERIEPTLKSLLAELALLGIAIDVCEHFSPRETYRLLLDTICREQRAYPELRNTQWVQHFCTYDFCKKCEAEFEEKFSSPESEGEKPEGE